MQTVKIFTVLAMALISLGLSHQANSQFVTGNFKTTQQMTATIMSLMKRAAAPGGESKLGC